MTYEIKAPKVEAEVPQHLRNKNATEIVDYLRNHFKTNFEFTQNGARETPLNKSTAYMTAVSKAIFDPQDWRNPVKVWFGPGEWIKAAIIWYHGAEPQSNGYWVYSPGYACW